MAGAVAEVYRVGGIVSGGFAFEMQCWRSPSWSKTQCVVVKYSVPRGQILSQVTSGGGVGGSAAHQDQPSPSSSLLTKGCWWH